jgi:hypothetical protein
MRAFMPPPSRHRARHAAALLLASLTAACGSAPETPLPATTPRTLTALPETIWVQPGDMGTLPFQLRGPSNAPLPGADVTFTIVDNPDTPGADAQGATLAAASATTDADGMCQARVTAGMPTVFLVRATSADATAEATIVVAAGVVGSVDVAPFFPSPAGDHSAALATTIEILFFDNSACHDIPPRAPPQSTRRMRSVSASDAVVRYLFVSTAVSHAILGRAVDARGVVLALGCTDLPGSALVAGAAVQIALPLVDTGPDPVGTFSATSVLDVAPPLAAAATLAATWRDLTDCPLDPAQRWLDCTTDALGPTSDVDPLDCVPATAPGGDGPLGDALGALRGTPLPGPDGKPTACRGSRTSLGAVSADATVQGLFGSPLPSALVHLEAAGDDAAHLFDQVKLRSTLDLRAGATPSDVSLTHTLTELTFALPGASVDVALLPLGLPALSTQALGTIEGGLLTIAEHGFTVRLGTAGRVAFGTLGLARRGLPPDAPGLVVALAALAHSDDGSLTGCAAVDAALCPQVGRPAGCLVAACASGLGALATQLDTAFESADGEGLDLYLAGRAPLLDTHGDGRADRLGDLQVPSQAGTWTVDLRPRDGRRTIAARWEAIRGGN